MKTLSKEDLAELSAGGKQAFVDFFAPWCPPCMRLLPEFRRASTIIGIFYPWLFKRQNRLVISFKLHLHSI